MKFRLLLLLVLTLTLAAQSGRLSIGFDIDDTVLFSRDVFLNVPEGLNSDEYWSWINLHDRDYSIVIPPTRELIVFLQSRGHRIYFITSRKPQNGTAVAEFLTDSLGFEIRVGKELFFSPSEKVDGISFTTKHKVMRKLKLDIYYGDSDDDILAAIKADVHPVRVVRHEASWKEYGANYFGDVLKEKSAATPWQPADLPTFYEGGAGPFGESIYPLVWKGPR